MCTLATAAARRNMQSRRRRGKAFAAGIPALWLLTDAMRGANPLVVVRRLPRGSGMIIRHTDDTARRKLAQALMPLCRRLGITCLIAVDWRLAAAVRADGVHLPERLAGTGVAAGAFLWRRTRGRLLTVAAHGAAALVAAQRSRADAAFLAPVFATRSHPNTLPLGTIRTAALTKRARVPVLALGGVSLKTIPQLTGSGVSGIAGIGWAENPPA